MKVFVTGARGFVGRWLVTGLEEAGHQVAGGGERIEVADREALRGALTASSADAVAHLAAVSFAPDAAADPARALQVNVGGTLNLMEVVRELPRPPAVLVAGSSEVYGAPAPDELPLDEAAPVRPRTPYALSKAAQEGLALAHAARYGLRVVVTRSFNHTGPGQRPVFVVPALARRVLAVRAGRESRIPAGNVHVRRDFTDVRDVARAYRLLLEALVRERIAPGGAVLNVASGRGVGIDEVLHALCRIAGVEARIEVDRSLIRPDDPPEIRGDARALTELTGWTPTIDLETTLRDVLAAESEATEAPSGEDGRSGVARGISVAR